ncbi:GNAT family N-acetyltransferase [Citreicella sp. C3M06]|nr:GNAT family N-acetyltransferase [Citreicella sp. C3M06]
MIDASKPRRATIDDIPACAAVINSWIDRTDWFPRLYGPEVIQQAFHDAWDKREIFVIGAPVEGYVSLDPAQRKIAALYTARPGAGLGKALLDTAKDGREMLFLHTHVPNEAAQRFYRREGFVQVGGALPPEPPEIVPEIRMEWRA